MTGPPHNAELTRAQIRVPVDKARQMLDLETLEAAWQLDGAVWYSHACCAAGIDARAQFHGLFESTGDVMRTLDGVAAACGPVRTVCVAMVTAPQARVKAKRQMRS